MHFSLVVISTPHMPNVRCFDDVVLPMYYALRRLGYEVEMRQGSLNPAAINICFGSNYDPLGRFVPLLPESIIMNLEQLSSPAYPWHKKDDYFNLLSRFKLWDFSHKNIELLASKSISAEFLPLGFVPEMQRLRPCDGETIDVLFYGALTPRRHSILSELRGCGLKVAPLTCAYGLIRDQAIFSAKIFLNIHHSVPASLEVVRLAYVLANGRAVVSELNDDTDYYPELKGACLFAPYEDLVKSTRMLIDDEMLRRKQAASGFEIFSNLDFCASLENLVGRRVVYGLGASFEQIPLTTNSLKPENPKPDKPQLDNPKFASLTCLIDKRPDYLNLGCGIDFRNQALNIDINPAYQPDLVLDMGAYLEDGAQYETTRFGLISLTPGSFKQISCLGLLGVIDKPEILMFNLRQLLANDGLLLISVPYHLSEYKGQRAYSKSAWANDLGHNPLLEGEDSRLEVVDIIYILSDLGRAKQALGYNLESLGRTFGAISEMKVLLRKKISSKADKQAKGRGCYLKPAITWEVASPTFEDDLLPQGQLPKPLYLRLSLLGLKLRRYRYCFNVRFGKNKGRYEEKLNALDLQIEQKCRILKLFRECS
ncbi:MAG: hypothetical protein ACRCTY_01485 [Candidatus Adiutrix sp.]